MAIGIGLGLFTLVMATCSSLTFVGQSTELLLVVPFIYFVPCMIFVVFPLLIWWSVRRAYRNNPAAQQETILRFTPQGIASSNAIASSEFTWDALIEVLETKKDFLFFPSKQAVFPVPKAAIPSPEEQQRLRRLVIACAGERAKLQHGNSSQD
jgi:hypothetical protein